MAQASEQGFRFEFNCVMPFAMATPWQKSQVATAHGADELIHPRVFNLLMAVLASRLCFQSMPEMIFSPSSCAAPSEGGPF